MIRPALGLALILAACGEKAPASFADCADLDCQRQWVATRWEANRVEVRQAIEGQRDPLLRVALVRAVSDAHPATTMELCQLLPDGPERVACEKQNQRPHLAQVEVRSTDAASTSQDSEDHAFVLDHPVPSPWEGLPADPAGCPAEDRDCLGEAAKAKAAAGDARGAAAVCAALSAPLWRADCVFQAAETTAARSGAVAGTAIPLCLGASDLVGRCLSHVVKNLGDHAPRAGSDTDAERWQALVTAISTGADELGRADQALGRAFADQAWAYALRVSYAQESTPNGAPIAVIPEVALPHLRASLAWRLWALEGAQARDLAAWQARLAEALADRATHAAPRKAVRGVSQVVEPMWTPLPGEEALPAIPWLSNADRVLGEDEASDLLICLLEAAARSPPVNEALLAEALKHPSARVRWTAARLLGAVKPNSRMLLKGDRDPLVRARLRAP